MLLLLIIIILLGVAILETVSILTSAIVAVGLIVSLIGFVIFDKIAERNARYRAMKNSWDRMEEKNKQAIKVAAVFTIVFMIIFITLELL